MGQPMTTPAEQWAQLFRDTALVVESHQSELTQLDSVVGDGDHGVNLCAGFESVVASLDREDTATAQSVLSVVSRELQAAMAGTAGLLLGRYFHVASRAIEDRFDAETITLALEAGAVEIAKRGKVAVGDRSMLDALAPAAQAARAAANSAGSAAAVLRAAADAGRHGAERTADLAPRVGRAARATQLATGHADAGATSAALILDSWATTVEKGELHG